MRTKMRTMIAIIAGTMLLGCSKTDETKPDESKKYTNFKITNIKVTAMPFTDGGGGSWDISNGPDVFFRISDSGGNVLFDGEGAKINDVVAANLPIQWNFTSAYQITNITLNKYIHIYDYDTADPNDYIASVPFKMEEHKSNYPSSITKVSGSLSVTITGSWY